MWPHFGSISHIIKLWLMITYFHILLLESPCSFVRSSRFLPHCECTKWHGGQQGDRRGDRRGGWRGGYWGGWRGSRQDGQRGGWWFFTPSNTHCCLMCECTKWHGRQGDKVTRIERSKGVKDEVKQARSGPRGARGPESGGRGWGSVGSVGPRGWPRSRGPMGP